jgi:hypothetical protein
MTQLTRISILTRKIIRYGIFGLIGIIIVRAIFLSGVKIYRYFFPPPPPPPTVAFGKLPKLPFPIQEAPKEITFSLQTPTGEMPKFPLTANVYFMPKLSSQLLSLDGAKNKAEDLGFDPNGAEITETIYSFKNPRFPSELKISIVTGVFSISYDLTKDPSPLEKRPVAGEIAAARARSFMSSAKILPDDLTGPTLPIPVKLENQKVIGAASLSDANFIKVNFFRKNYNDLPSLTSEPNKANVWFIVSGESQKEKQIIAAEYHYFPVDETKYATYPIKTAKAAWDEFQKGGGYIASLGSNQGGNIVIRRLYLAYYDAGVPTDFFQPIIVFEGDKNFVGYVPAVTADYYGE